MFHAFLILILGLSGAWGWGFRGHIAISRVAFSMLHENTVSFMSRIMRTPVGPPEFAEMSVWADKVARVPRYDWSKNLHFTRKSKCLPHYIVQQDPDCLLSSVTHFADVLMNRDEKPKLISDPDALRFLIHFAGDLHAPFHIGDDEDLNGGGIIVYDPVLCLVEKKTPSSPTVSLHGVWDSHILKIRESQTGQKLEEIVNNFVSDIQKEKQTTLRGRSLGFKESESLAELSIRAAFASRTITKEIGLVDPKGQPILSRTHLSREYFDRACPLALAAVKEAGVNLATILNRIADANQ